MRALAFDHTRLKGSFHFIFRLAGLTVAVALGCKSRLFEIERLTRRRILWMRGCCCQFVVECSSLIIDTYK